MKSIMRRDSQQSYDKYLKRLARAEGVEANDAAALRCMDRKRPKTTRNDEWVNPADAEAEITRLKTAHRSGVSGTRSQPDSAREALPITR
jgi:hypothetical protein